MSISPQYDQLLEVLAGGPPCAVAFSGGVDSSLVLKAAVEVFGNSTIAFFADSILQAPGEREHAERIARMVGCDFKIITIDPLSWPELLHNPVDRCYHCKKRIYSLFLDLLPDPSLVLVDGSNLDDLDDHRPGRRAIAELSVYTPLIEAKLGKNDIRKIAKSLLLPNWNKMSASCLATRLSTGMDITEERLGLVAKCESVLNDMNFLGCRVRIMNGHENEVKVEVVKKDINRFFNETVRENILLSFYRFGVDKVSLDLSGR